MASNPEPDIDMMRDFTRYPAGRYKTDGPWSGEKFREEILIPLLKSRNTLVINLDSALGYGSSFLEEAFGGLVRSGFPMKDILTRIHILTSDIALKEEIESYIREAEEGM